MREDFVLKCPADSIPNLKNEFFSLYTLGLDKRDMCLLAPSHTLSHIPLKQTNFATLPHPVPHTPQTKNEHATLTHPVPHTPETKNEHATLTHPVPHTPQTKNEDATLSKTLVVRNRKWSHCRRDQRTRLNLVVFTGFHWLVSDQRSYQCRWWKSVLLLCCRRCCACCQVLSTSSRFVASQSP